MNFNYKPTKRNLDCNLCTNKECICRRCRGKLNICHHNDCCIFSENKNCYYLKTHSEFIIGE